MIFLKGMRDRLDKYVDVNDIIEIEINLNGPSVYDFCCFGVDINNRLSDDKYMVFYNQTSTPKKEISYSANTNNGNYTVDLSKLPIRINKLVFTISIDGNGTMKEITSCSIVIKQSNQNVININLNGNDFKNEKSIISIEIYRKNEWKIASILSGFDGGLPALLKLFGGEEIKEQKKISENTLKNKTIQKEKEIVTEKNKSKIISPKKISLKKGQKISLNKNGSSSIIVENGWTAKGKDYDLKALVRYRNGKMIYIGAANYDEYLSTPDGAVKHGGDIESPGELEHIKISWNQDIASVAVSSYSAIENGTGSFYKYGVFVRIKNGSQIIEIPAANTSANDKSYTLCFGEILFGDEPNSFVVSALEMYSRPNSEHRIGYINGVVTMDIGPSGKMK